MSSMFTATNVTQHWHSVNIINARATQRQLSLFVWQTTHITHAQRSVWKNVTVKWGWTETFPVLRVCREHWWSHSRPVSPSPWGRRSGWTHPHRAGTTPSLLLHPLTKRKSVWYLHIIVKQRSTRTMASSPFCNPACTQSKRKRICGQFRMALMIKWGYYEYKAKHQPPGWAKFSLVK